MEGLGEVKGKSLLHLQCHFGQDSLSWARKGAKVTAVDFSPSAIKAAKTLSEELDIEVEFIESNVLTLDLKQEFDVVFMSYGTRVGCQPQTMGSSRCKHLNKEVHFLLLSSTPS